MSSALRYGLLALLALLLLLGYSWFKGKPFLGSKPKDALVVGLQSGYPPFEFMDSQGEIVGFDVDLANLLAKKMSKPLLIEDMPFSEEINALKTGDIDLIISGMNITPDRLKEIDMIPYHGDKASSLSLVFWGKVPEGVKSLEDLQKQPNSSVSVASGTVAENYMHYYPNLPIRSFEGSLATLMDIKEGKSTASLAESDVATYLKKTYPEVQVIQVQIPPEFALFGFGIGVKKGNRELYEKVKKSIDELKTDGMLEQLEKKWFKS